ncbi:MAG TPA: PilW family protein, partial [Thermoanaerobaculia bacterium]|nr:PilW family protein [Thermoanaerobaculia bacterium]
MAGNRSRRGFGLVEAMVTVGITVVTMVGLLTMLEGATRVAKAETNAADAQGSGRSGISYLTRILREARVGRLSYGSAILPYAENAAAGTTLTDAANTVHTLVPGTDAIEAHGIFGEGSAVFGPADVTCAGTPCTLGSSAISVTIRQQTVTGYVNYPAGGAPAIASRTSPFYFVVSTSAPQTIAVGTSSYVAPLYVVGRVNASAGSWYTTTSSTFTFTMDATDSGARAFDATADTDTLVASPTTGGPVDAVVFFVDRGEAGAGSPAVYPHPFLAQATKDAATGRWKVEEIAPDAEDFQVAYGIDGADGSAPDGGVDAARVSTLQNKDEWVSNVAGETLTVLQNPPRVEKFYDTSVPSAPPFPATAAPALRAILVSLVTKSAAPDVRYSGPGALGMKTLDSTALSVSAANGRRYRRTP